ncbi:hypothetical protein [Mesorhizobium sp.]|uniref:hypothetical protein n=1 Tax=Mesorhizobium sp. TaxID=1871066 RepID=UPI000FE73FF6|nr:hypothetical protein [Mesorhizobium sp.]RWI97918.1 MAG: hypothetical protein EOR22_06260 [Mesorhizobium sp.]TIQ07796.1 MAG: hypothetical protein E5X50_15785 [Mesorhizobium sp.]TIR22094.1 MAG: hypothetical protein E5X33_09085 [Mesorhizobium sp.]
MDRASHISEEAGTSRAAPDLSRLLFEPNLRVHGLIDQTVVSNVLHDLKAVRDGGNDLYVEIDTPDGDADGARRIALEIKLFLKHSGRNGFVLGKTRSILPGSPSSQLSRRVPGFYVRGQSCWSTNVGSKRNWS